MSLCYFLDSSAINLNIIDVVMFLDWVSTLLQSEREWCFDWIFCLAVVYCKSHCGRGKHNAAVCPPSQNYRQKCN